MTTETTATVVNGGLELDHRLDLPDQSRVRGRVAQGALEDGRPLPVSPSRDPVRFDQETGLLSENGLDFIDVPYIEFSLLAFGVSVER